jgi:class 3 adenylate cyclase
MIPGKKVIAIYGFCDIRNFTDTTEVLQERVMVFVNEIAEIVHEITTDHCGSANKNIGDAFLLIWKFEDSFTENESGELKLKNISQVNQIVDCSLITFLKILSKVKKSYKLDKVKNIL